MADEAVLMIEIAPPLPFTVADGTGIEKGAILKMTDFMTAIISSGTDDVIAGIAAEEKIANDGRTSIGVYRQGIFRVLAGGSITVGDQLKSNAGTKANEVLTATNATLSGKSLGIALETAADTNTFLMELAPGKATMQLLA